MQTEILLTFQTSSVLVVNHVDNILDEQDVIPTVDGGAELVYTTDKETTVKISPHFHDQHYTELHALLLKEHIINKKDPNLKLSKVQLVKEI